MIRIWFCLFLFLTHSALAAPIAVTSGEHDGFTRLVFDYGKVVDWKIGRSADGYVLRTPMGSGTYDLTRAFSLIGKSRLAAIWVDPQTEAVHVGLACACHAIPFEFRPGILVIDLKDGPPPAGSSFEMLLDGGIARPLTERPRPRPKPRPATLRVEGSFDWTKIAFDKLRLPAATAPETSVEDKTSVLLADPSLQPLRDTLLYQMARGAAQGVVDMAKPANLELSKTAFPLAQISIGEPPQHIRLPKGAMRGDLTAAGEECIAAETLDITTWGDPSRSLVAQMAEVWTSLSGEFDIIDPKALSRAVRLQLYLGFGAEARQIAQTLAPENPDFRLWISLSYLVDGETDPSSLFSGQAACNGPAALWALLAAPHMTEGDSKNTGAIRLAFADLPLHLRRHLGPNLADRFLKMGDQESARALQDSILRAPGDPGASIALMAAELDLHGGDPIAAEEKIFDVLRDPGQASAQALVALINARVSQGLPVEPAVAVALQSLLSEHAGSKDAPRLRAAVTMALAASGDFQAAFAALAESPEVAPQVWALTSNLAPDHEFLVLAVLDGGPKPPALGDELSQSIARRLLALGLPRPAEHWLQTAADPDPILKAQVHLGLSDGRTALIALAGQTSAEAQALKLRALDLTNQQEQRAAMLTTAEQPDAASLALARAGDWSELAERGAGPWKALAARLSSTFQAIPSSSEATAPTSDGPLARAHQLASAGTETRAEVEALLATLAKPSATSP